MSGIRYFRLLAIAAGMMLAATSALAGPEGLWVGTAAMDKVGTVNSTGSDLSFDLEVTAEKTHEAKVVSGEPWKYDISGTDLGTGWRGAAFNDNAWASGEPRLAHDMADAALYHINGLPYGMSGADINKDGFPDLVVSATAYSGMNVIYSSVTWSLGTRADTTVSGNAFYNRLADFDSDGNMDMAVSLFDTGKVAVLWGDGTGAFEASATEMTVGTNPYELVARDFTGDGVPDIAVANNGSNTISVLVSDGVARTFQTKPALVAGTAPWGLTSEDFNGDTIADLAVTDKNTNDMKVYLGAGDGTFLLSGTYITGDWPINLNTGDVNNDGFPDLLVPCHSANQVMVFINDGEGTFTASGAYNTVSMPHHVAVADFNSDGNMDMAAVNRHSTLGNSVSVFTGDGLGGFIPSGIFATGTGPVYVVAADANKDKVIDLVTANVDADSISVLLGNGDGTFQPKTDKTVQDFPRGVAVGDLDGDNVPDIVAASYNAKNVSVFKGDIDWTYSPNQTYQTNGKNRYVEAADFNGDGLLDAVSSNSETSDISFIKGYADYQGKKLLYNKTEAEYPTASGLYWVKSADFNGDGKLDIAGACRGANVVSVLIGNGNGTFQAKADYPTGSLPEHLAAADLNGDDIADLAVVNMGSSNVSVLLCNGDGTFQQKTDYPVGNNPRYVTAADLNGDGSTDLAVTNWADATMSVLLGNGDGTFQAKTDYVTGGYPFGAGTGDYDGDGHVDIVVADHGADKVSMFIGNGNGTFAPKVDYPVGDGCLGLVAADLDLDGKMDVATVNYNSDDVTILLGNGDGTLAVHQNAPLTANTARVSVADINNDGKRDIVASSEFMRHVAVFMGNGDGTFQAQSMVRVGVAPYATAFADMDGDGKQDMLVCDWVPDKLYVMPGNGDGSFGTSTGYSVKADPWYITPVDLDGDGDLDVVTGGWWSYGFTVLKNSGNGTLGSRADYSVESGNKAGGATPGDFDKDGDIDLAVGGWEHNNIHIFTNDGSGVFQDSATYDMGDNVFLPAAADFDGDGYLDIAACLPDQRKVVLLMNDKDGTFTPGAQLSSPGYYPVFLTAADLNRDGFADIAAESHQTDSVAVFLGNGDGTFQPGVAYASGNYPYFISGGDLNNDGLADIVAACKYTGGVAVHLGRIPVTAYFRKTFTVGSPQDYDGLRLRLRRDDGAVVYLNGVEIARDNMPAAFGYDTLALSNISAPYDTQYVTYDLTNAFAAGDNVLAAEVHQSGLDYDLGFDLELNAKKPGSGMVLVNEGDSGWLYDDSGADLGDAWKESGYQDGSWQSGTAQFGYGNDGEETGLSYAGDYPRVTYFRKHFDVPAAGEYSSLSFSLKRDDGAVVYLNGVEIARDNMPSGPTGFGAYSTIYPSRQIGPSEEWRYNVHAAGTNALKSGDNVVAVSVFQHPGELAQTEAPSEWPTQTASPLNIRLMLHVDGSGHVRLLKDVIQMYKEPVYDTDGNEVAPGRYVLLTDDSLVPNYTGVSSRDGAPVGRRISSAAFDFPRPERYIELAGTFAAGGALTGAFTLDPDHPTNPFLHRYHPDHDNLDERYQAYRQEANLVTRDIEITLDDPSSISSEERKPGLGSTIIEGTYTETFTGLHKKPIKVTGRFTLTRVSDVAVLDQ